MSSLLASLQSAGDALSIFESAMGVVQSNTTNASTPGYVDRQANLTTDSLGNVATAATTNSRNQFAEQAVWQQGQFLGAATQQATNLSYLQAQFDVTGKSGIPNALSGLYAAFSSWSTNPDDPTARSQVLTAAKQVAQQFNETAQNVQKNVDYVNQQLSSTVSQINGLSAKIAAINQQIRNGDRDNPSLQTQLYNDLQQLSSFASISVHTELDGTATVLMNEQTPLVIGVTPTALQVSYASSGSPSATMPDARIINASGQDVTLPSGAGGQLGGLLQIRNHTLPGLIGGPTQQGSLNQLAQGIADRVNALLTSGTTGAGVAGKALFTYSSSGVAASLAVDPTVQPSDLAAASSSAANGIATQLAGLQNPTHSADMINGVSYTDFYSVMASDLGTQASDAAQAKSSQTDLLSQAENMRSQISGVSLDEQATKLLQFQQAYAASAKLITVINQMTADLMNAVQPLSA